MSDVLKELVRGVYGTAKRIVESGDEAVPMVFALGADGGVSVHVPDFSSSSAKVQSMAMIASAMRKEGVKAYAFVSEAWVVSMKQEHATPEVLDRMRPSKDDRRIECVIVQGGTATGDSVMLMGKITRAGDAVSVADMEEMGDGESGGRLANLLVART